MPGQAPTAPPRTDDGIVQQGEKIWRLLDPQWYQSDPSTPNGPKRIAASAFSGDVSALRVSYVSEAMVDVAFGGKFQRWGIMEFDEREIRDNGCGMVLDVQPEWPADAHVLIVKEPNGGRLNPTIKKTSLILQTADHFAETPSRGPAATSSFSSSATERR
jgi:hypothetical protein